MRIIDNHSTNHSSILQECLAECDEAIFIVAFLKMSGLETLKSKIKNALKRKSELKIICGLDFYQTEPDALKLLSSMSKKFNNLQLYIYNQNASSTFHPKVYFFKKNQECCLITGSANFTSGGFHNNIEVSTLSKFSLDSKQFSVFKKIFKSILDNSKKADDIEISRYSRKFRIHRDNEKSARDRSKKEEKALFNLDTNLIEKELKLYFADEKEQKDYQIRVSNYKNAKSHLEKIRTENLSKKDFFDLYENLVGKAGKKSLWHSGSIYRGKSKVQHHHLRFKELLDEIYSNLDKESHELYSLVQAYIKYGSNKKIDGMGPNILTEIFNTYRPSKFGVLNDNPLTSIKFFSFEDFPNSQSFKPENYRDFNLLLTGIMKAYKLTDLGQVDHFLNYIYWKHKDS
ncbi:MAG: phospholipase D-like domain-containing protein [Candidatus Paceibacterota bacterium]